ncbi:MAG TPA: SpoIIE family protein phosphatase [Bacteroidota bacterium]|nr:SpoIIE family protein phosphatase [Bacteroidota bacterium]
MPAQSPVDRLRHNILFENISDEEFDRVKEHLRERHYHAGVVVVEDDSEGEELFLLLEGRVKILKRTREGGEKLLALLHAGDFFGELELLDGRPRSARVVALDDCIAFALHQENFHKLIGESHPFALRLLQVLSVRLRSSNNHFLRELELNSDRFARQLKKSEQLIEATKSLNSTLDLDKLLVIILETALRTVDSERGTVYLLDEAKGELWSRVLIGSEIVKIELPLGKGIAGYVAATGDTLNIQDAYLDPRFNPDIDKRTGYRTNTILCVPMRDKDGRIIGVFQLLNKRTGYFTREDESVIAGLSIHAALALENARLYEQEKKLFRMREEVRLAARIQLDLLPKKIPAVPGYDLAGRTIPAQMVGGDYFDFIPGGRNRWAVCLGDVTGKGLPAALLMANVQATLRGLTEMSGGASECVRRANTLLYRSTSDERFVTLFYGLLDPATHALTFTNAGQDHPFLVSGKKKIRRLRTGGTVLGIIDQFPFEEETVSLARGDVLVIYSDGFSEAMNEQEEQFGEERLAKVIEGNKRLSAEKIIDHIVAETRRFTGAAPQSDDMTIVVVKRIA